MWRNRIILVKTLEAAPLLRGMVKKNWRELTPDIRVLRSARRCLSGYLCFVPRFITVQLTLFMSVWWKSHNTHVLLSMHPRTLNSIGNRRFVKTHVYLVHWHNLIQNEPYNGWCCQLCVRPPPASCAGCHVLYKDSHVSSDSKNRKSTPTPWLKKTKDGSPLPLESYEDGMRVFEFVDFFSVRMIILIHTSLWSNSIVVPFIV